MDNKTPLLFIMALENFSSGKIYLSIADGKLVQQFKEAQEGTKERINKNARVVHEKFYDAIVGHLTGVIKRENDYGIFLEIGLHDGEDQYQISTQFSGRYSSSFLKALANVKLNEKVRIMPWSMVDKNDATKKVTGLTMYHNDGNNWVKLAPYYTKDDPKGLPQMVKVKLKGKETWDDSDMMDFLYNAAGKIFESKPKPKPAPVDEKPLKKGETYVTDSLSEDDLPF